MRSVCRLLVLSASLFSWPLAATTFHVNSTADAVDAVPGDGICAAASGACTLRAAVMEANQAAGGPHAVDLPAGLYVLSIAGVGENGTARGDLDLTAGMTIAGVGAATTIVDGGGLDRVFEVFFATTVRISGLTVRNGAALAPGLSAGDQSVNFVGGGVLSTGTLTLADCVVAGNQANAGGGIWSSGTLTVERCAVRDNVAADTGLTNAEGGGLLLQEATTVGSSTVSGNRARNGGGIHVQGAQLSLTNVTLSGNTASGPGALSSTNGLVTMVNATVAGNVGFPGVSHYSFDGMRPITFRNTLFANNGIQSCEATAGTAVSLGGNVDVGTSCGLTAASDRTTTDARIGPLAANGGATLTRALLAGSPAIDAGVAEGCPGGDQRGVARPKGSACDSGAFEAEPAAQFSAARTIPIVLDVVGGTGAHFTSELTLANRGTTAASLQLVYTAATALGGSGSGPVSETLGPGQELVVADAIGYLRGKGLPIPASGNQGGTLRVVFSGLSSADAGYAGARTTSASGAGRAGLAYPGVRAEDAASGGVHLFGLRDDAADRTNLALVNAGAGSIELRLSLFSGVAGDARRSDQLVTLAAGQWTQINAPQLLRAAGMTNAWALVQPVSGVAPFLAYAVFNDNRTDDGSFVPAVPALRTSFEQVLPVLVESDAFESELVLANPGDQALQVTLTFDLSLGSFAGSTRSTTETLAPRQQRIIPSAIQYLRERGLSIDSRGAGKTFVGILRASFSTSLGPSDGFLGARTASPAPSGGGYGLFYTGVAAAEAASGEAWVYGLIQDAQNRSNLAILNNGFATLGLRVDVFDAASGALAGGQDVTLESHRWTQLNTVLQTYGLTAGYARITVISGPGPFVAYGVVNDGAVPGSGTSDGSYVAMSVTR